MNRFASTIGIQKDVEQFRNTTILKDLLLLVGHDNNINSIVAELLVSVPDCKEITAYKTVGVSPNSVFMQGGIKYKGDSEMSDIFTQIMNYKKTIPECDFFSQYFSPAQEIIKAGGYLYPTADPSETHIVKEFGGVSIVMANNVTFLMDAATRGKFMMTMKKSLKPGGLFLEHNAIKTIPEIVSHLKVFRLNNENTLSSIYRVVFYQDGYQILR